MVSCTPAFSKTNSQLLWHFVDQAAKSHLNDPKHTPRKASKWSQQNNIYIYKCPAQPPVNALLCICGNTPGKGSVFMRFPLMVHAQKDEGDDTGQRVPNYMQAKKLIHWICLVVKFILNDVLRLKFWTLTWQRIQYTALLPQIPMGLPLFSEP